MKRTASKEGTLVERNVRVWRFTYPKIFKIFHLRKISDETGHLQNFKVGLSPSKKIVLFASLKTL